MHEEDFGKGRSYTVLPFVGIRDFLTCFRSFLIT